MELLNLTKYFSKKFLYLPSDTINENDIFTMFDYHNFPRKKITSNDIIFDFSTITDKAILCNKQVIEINNTIKKIAFAGCSISLSNQGVIKIVFEDDTFIYKKIKFSDYTWDINNSIQWMVGLQKKEYKNYSQILYECYNYKYDVNNIIYKYFINIETNKKVKSIVLPNNKLILLFAITII